MEQTELSRSDLLLLSPLSVKKLIAHRLLSNGVVAEIRQQVMISPAPGDRYTRDFLTGRPSVFSLFIAPTYAITSPT